MDQIGLMKAYLTLTALKKKVPRSYQVKEKYVREYNSAIDLLAQASGYNLNSFRVPESEIQRKLLSSTIDGPLEERESHYAPDLYCDRAVLMKKLGPILTFFTVTFTVTSTKREPHVDFKLPSH